MAVGLEAGVARTVITPPVGSPMYGFAGRGPATGTHDDLTATALALRCGETMGVILGIDLCTVPGDDVAAWSGAVTEKLGIPAAHQLYCASHTHYGPAYAKEKESESPFIAPYRKALSRLLLNVAERACDELQPVKLGHGLGTTDIGINRREELPDGRVKLGRNPNGACDRELHLLRFDRLDGRPLAAVVNAAVHPVSGGGTTRGISAGWPGLARRAFEPATGAKMVFLQGAAGNINSLEMTPGHGAAVRLGERFAGQALAVWRSIEPTEATGLSIATRDLALPRYSYGTQAQAAALEANLSAELAKLPDEPSGHRWWVEFRLSNLRDALAPHRGERPLPPWDIQVSGWRIGDCAVASSPGEVFCELGLAIKAHSKTPRTLFAGYTNHSIMYVPTPEAYAEGGYEVDNACRVDPPAGGMIVTGCVACLRESWDAVAEPVVAR